MSNSTFYFSNFQINRVLYDNCIHSSFQANLYGFSWYLDLVSPKWGAIIYGNDEKYQAVMPLPFHQKLGISYVIQPLFCQQLGVYSIKKLDNKIYNSFIKILFNKFHYTGKYFLNINNSKFDFPLIQTETFFTHHLDLSKPYSEIYQNYNRDRKINLKRAKKSNQQIIENQDINALIKIFQENTAHKIQGGVHPSAYELLRQIYAELQKRNLVRLLYTKNNSGEITSGVMIAFHQNQLIYLFNAGKSTFRKSNGRTLILNHLFQEYAEQELIFDFESPNITEISGFYESFGAEKKAFYRINYNHFPFWVRSLQRLKAKILTNNLF